MGFNPESLLNMFTDQTLPRVDVSSPMQRQAFGRVSNEYDQAAANPNYGMPSPELQRLTEDQLARDINARTATGSGHSGYQGEQIRKGLVDFRIGMFQQRQRALDAIRSSMVGAAGPGMAEAGIQPGILNNAARGIGGYAARSAAKDIFGDGGDSQADSQQSGGAPGTTGYRSSDTQGRSGGMRVT